MTTGNAIPKDGEGEERGDGDRDQRRVRQSPAADPDHGLGDDREHGRSETGEQRDHRGGLPERDVDRGERQHGEHAGHDEQDEDARDQAAPGAVEQSPDVDGDLLGLGTGSQDAVVLVAHYGLCLLCPRRGAVAAAFRLAVGAGCAGRRARRRGTR